MKPDSHLDQIEDIHNLLFNREQQEDIFVSDWFNSKNNIEQLDTIAGLRTILDEPEISYLTNEDVKRINRRTRNRFIPFSLYITIAASVIAFVAIGLVWNAKSNVSNHEVLLYGENGKIYQLSGNETSDVINDFTGVSTNEDYLLDYSEAKEISQTKTITLNTLAVPRGGIYCLKLSDGSKVWLNADTKLKYPTTFNSEVREVFLEGEAYFEVQPDSMHPFIVNHNNVLIKAYGTSFNVKAYPNEKKIAATLIMGNISMQSKVHKETFISVNEQITYSSEEAPLEIQLVNIEQILSWREGLFSFNSCSLEDLALQIERWYDVEVLFIHPELKTYEFRGTINKNLSLTDILAILKESTRLSINQNKNTIIIAK